MSPKDQLPALSLLLALLTIYFSPLLMAAAGEPRIVESLLGLDGHEIVRPRILPMSESTRERRSAKDEDSEPMLISIGNWTLRIVKNDRLMLSKDFEARLIAGESIIDDDVEFGKLDCKLRHGGIQWKENKEIEGQRKEERSNDEDLAVLTICGDDVYGLINVRGRSYYVQPLTNGRHVLYEARAATRWRSRKFQRNYVAMVREDATSTGENTDPSLEKQNDSIRRDKRFDREDREDGKTRVSRGSSKKRVPREIPTGEIDASLGRTRRHSTLPYARDFYNLTGDFFDEDRFDLDKSRDDVEHADEKSSTEKDEVVIEQLTRDGDSEDVGYFSNPAWTRNKSSKKEEPTSRWLELAIAADYSVVAFHGSRVRQYILALLNIVSAIYKDPSLDSNMILVIARMILYAEKNDGVVRDGNARRSLENVNAWNRKLLALSSERHDLAIWLTRLDIGGPSGYAPVSGACDPSRSCALNRDEGLTSAFIIAHEVAHILGLTHDGDKSAGNVCAVEASHGSVMAPMVAATFHRFYWSTCSRKEFHRKVKHWSCLLNRPRDGNVTQLRAIMQETFTMDEQCRMEFGEGYELCKSFDIRQPCSRLWCGNTNVSRTCKTKKGPPLEGTLCDENRWCINGYCESIDRRKFDETPVLHSVRNGGWSSWTAWGKCSRSCGVGVQCRSRRCNNPRPAFGGNYCSGANDDCRICESAKCLVPMDLRAQQCSRLSSILDFKDVSSRRNVTWLAYEPERVNLKCQLVCRSKETGEILYSGKNLLNGTPCSYGSTDICIQGECRRMGCDNQLNSKKVINSCGICDADESSCDNVIAKFQRKLRRGSTRVAVLPRAAHSATVNITIVRKPTTSARTEATIVVKDGRKRRHEATGLDSRGQELLIVDGAAFRLRRIDNDAYDVRTSGGVLDDVIVSLSVPPSVVKEGTTIAVSSRYSISRAERNAKGRYAWLIGGWGFCSASCGGGTRRKTIACKDEKTGRIVSRKKCIFVWKPVQEVEKCNAFSCEYKWLTGPWQDCSTTCGNFGVKTRQLYCVESSFDDDQQSDELLRRVALEPSTCKDQRQPIILTECNRTPCPSRWLLKDWTSVRS